MDALAELVDALPEGVVVTDPVRAEKYRWDRSQDPGAGTPVAVVRAEDAAQVQATVRWAARHGVPVVPRARGPASPAGRARSTAGSCSAWSG